MTNLLSTPDFNRLPRLQKLRLSGCNKLKVIHPSLGNHTSLEYLDVSYCYKLKKLPRISLMKNIKTLTIMGCDLKDGDIPCGIDDLSSLEELNLSRNKFSQLGFSMLQLNRLKVLDVSFCHKLLKLPELSSSLTTFIAHECKSLRKFEDCFINCKQLCQVSIVDGGSDKLLQSMLKVLISVYSKINY